MGSHFRAADAAETVAFAAREGDEVFVLASSDAGEAVVSIGPAGPIVVSDTSEGWVSEALAAFLAASAVRMAEEIEQECPCCGPSVAWVRILRRDREVVGVGMQIWDDGERDQALAEARALVRRELERRVALGREAEQALALLDY